MSAINESLIRDVVAEVLGRLGQAPAAKAVALPCGPQQPCACSANGHASSASLGRGKYGVFQDANEACAAAQGCVLPS